MTVSSPPASPRSGRFPRVATVGLSGLLVQFSDRLDEAANRAALAFRAAIDVEAWEGVAETATSLTSTFLRFDPLQLAPDDLSARVTTLLASRDWSAADLPQRRRRWRVPVAFGGEAGPQLDEVAGLVGLSPEDAAAQITAQPVRVQTIGFAPGQPYLGTLPEAWDIPRQTDLTPMVPQGALVVAIRQLIVFSNATQTGWRQIGLTGFRCFRPDAAAPFALNAGDDIQFTPVSADVLHRMIEDDPEGMGGATVEALS
ncbi:allophanate hydrolase subunit 1 [Pseudoruegeria sp. SK021]|uniref:5-oxoprolinase subunit B family protein n=1 Tax=Pseudoruegeria sp. SK021 TaxID=1933035 RepID=UPI000A25A7A9|nr:carboxyltransferase domain-containing protein [Pseudoruegeria sp. SK021]OSP54044.1 allophanate hydrolase [Pseudoruegeria sp. SK021]